MDPIILLSDINRLVNSMIPGLNRIVVALIIIFLGFIIGKLIKNFLFTILKDVGVDKQLKRILKKEYSVGKVISFSVALIIYAVTLFLALDVFNIGLIVIYIVLGVLLLLGLFWFISYLIHFLPNYLSFNKYNKGDEISIKGFEGVIEKKGLIDIRVRRKNGDLIIIPNKTLNDLFNSF